MVERDPPNGDENDGAWTPWLEFLKSGDAALRRAAAAVSRWVDDHREGIGELAAGLMTIAILQPKLVELQRRWEGSDWAYLIERLDFINGLALMLLLSDSSDGNVDDAVLDFMEEALTDPQFVSATNAKLATAPLSAPQQKQLSAGLRYVREHNYEVAVPLMIVPLEGAFAGEAERRNLVRRIKTKLAYTEATDKPGKNVGSVDELFKLLGLDGDLQAFLHKQVYGAAGNAFRHGVALTGFRQKALTLTVALVSYLDLMNEEDGILLVEAFSRQEKAREILEKTIDLGAMTRPR